MVFEGESIPESSTGHFRICSSVSSRGTGSQLATPQSERRQPTAWPGVSPAESRRSSKSHASDAAVSAASAGTAEAARSDLSAKDRSCAKTVDDDEEEGEEDDEEEGDNRAKAPAHRRTAASRIQEEASEFLANTQPKFDPDEHYAKSKQKKKVDETVSRCRSWGVKCGKSGNEALGKQLFAEADLIEERQHVYDDFRERFAESFAKDLSPFRRKILAALPAAVVSKMITSGCSRLSSAALTDERPAELFYNVLAVGGPQTLTLDMVVVMQDDETSVLHMQKTLVLAHLEKAFKLPTLRQVAEACRVLTKHLESLGPQKLAQSLCDLKVGDGNIGYVHGWAPQLGQTSCAFMRWLLPVFASNPTTRCH